MHGILRLRDQIQGHEPAGWRERYDAVGTEELLPGATGVEASEGGDAGGAINVYPGGDTAGA